MRFYYFILPAALACIQPLHAQEKEVQLTNAEELFFTQKNDLETVYNKDGSLFSGAVRKKDAEGRNFTYFYRNGLRHGIARANYEDGKIECEITYRKGLKDGEEIYFLENGNPKFKKTYKENVLNGEELLFYENGKPKVQNHYLNGKLDGETTYFDENGNRVKIEHFKNGVKNGLEHIIADNVLIEENNYADGVLNGITKKYSKDYQTDEIAYKDGRKNGMAKHFNTDGSIIAIPYEDDLKNGTGTAYYPDNKIANTAEYVNDEKNGMSVKFFKDGKRQLAETYKNGKLEGVSRTFDKNGNLTKVRYYVDGMELASVNLEQNTELRDMMSAHRLGQISKYSSKKIYWYPLLWLALNTEDMAILQALEKDMKMYGAEIDDMAVYQRESKTKFADYTRNLYFGLLPLSYAVDLSAPVEILQKFAAPKQLNAQNPRGGTALQEAVRLNNLEMVRFLLLHKATVSAVKNSNILAQSIKENVRLPILEELIKAGADVNAPDNDGKLPVVLAVDKNEVNLLKLLKNNGADLNIELPDGKNLLFYAYDHERSTQIADFLLSSGVDANQPDKNGGLLILEALKKYDETMLNKLLEHGANVNKENSTGESAVSYVMENKYDTATIQKILAHNVNYSGLFGAKKQPLWRLAAENDASVLKQILDKNGGADKADAAGFVPLQILINWNGGDSSALKETLLSYLTPEWLNAHPKFWQQVLLAKNLKVWNDLVKIGFDVNVKDQNGQTAAWILLKNNYEPVWWSTLKKLKPDLNIPAENGKTLLQYAVENDSGLSLTKYLLQNGANIKTLDSACLAKLHGDRAELTELLLNYGANTSYISDSGETLLMSAVQNLNGVLFDYLLANGADVNARDNNGNTALFYVAEAVLDNPQVSKDEMLAQLAEVIAKLKQLGANINEQNGNGETVLVYLAKTQSPAYAEIEKILLEQGADETIKDQYGRTVANYRIK